MIADEVIDAGVGEGEDIDYPRCRKRARMILMERRPRSVRRGTYGCNWRPTGSRIRASVAHDFTGRTTVLSNNAQV